VSVWAGMQILYRNNKINREDPLLKIINQILSDKDNKKGIPEGIRLKWWSLLNILMKYLTKSI
jgi:hypothetical protein